MILVFEAKSNVIDVALRELPGIRLKNKTHVNEIRKKKPSEMTRMEKAIIK